MRQAACCLHNCVGLLWLVCRGGPLLLLLHLDPSLRKRGSWDPSRAGSSGETSSLVFQKPGPRWRAVRLKMLREKKKLMFPHPSMHCWAASVHPLSMCSDTHRYSLEEPQAPSHVHTCIHSPIETHTHTHTPPGPTPSTCTHSRN